MWLVLIAIAIVGLVCVRRGLRGRVIDDHPVCRACRFDLVGLDGSSKCPECGVSLQRPGAIIIGQRKRRARLAWGGAVLTFAAASLLANGWFVGSRGAAANAWKPFWLLRVESSMPDRSLAWNAKAEMLDRAKTGQLSAAQLDAWAEKLLRQAPARYEAQRELASIAQATPMPAHRIDEIIAFALTRISDRSLPYSPELSNVIEEAFYGGRLPADKFEAYLRSAAAPKLRILGGPALHAGQEAKVMFEWGWRGGRTPVFQSLGLPGVAPDEFGSGFEGTFGPVWSPDYGPTGSLVAGTELGSRRLAGTASLSLDHWLVQRHGPRDARIGGFPGGVANLPKISVEFPVAAEYEIKDGSIESDSERVQAALRSGTWVFARCDTTIGGKPAPNIAIFMDAGPLKYAVEATVAWRVQTVETSLASVALSASAGHSSSTVQHRGWQQGTGHSSSNQSRSQTNLYLPIGVDGPCVGTVVIHVHAGEAELDGKSVPISPFDIFIHDVRVDF